MSKLCEGSQLDLETVELESSDLENLEYNHRRPQIKLDAYSTRSYDVLRNFIAAFFTQFHVTFQSFGSSRQENV